MPALEDHKVAMAQARPTPAWLSYNGRRRVQAELRALVEAGIPQVSDVLPSEGSLFVWRFKLRWGAGLLQRVPGRSLGRCPRPCWPR